MKYLSIIMIHVTWHILNKLEGGKNRAIPKKYFFMQKKYYLSVWNENDVLEHSWTLNRIIIEWDTACNDSRSNYPFAIYMNIVFVFVVDLSCMFDWWVVRCLISWVKHNHFTASGELQWFIIHVYLYFYNIFFIIDWINNKDGIKWCNDNYKLQDLCLYYTCRRVCKRCILSLPDETEKKLIWDDRRYYHTSHSQI